MELLLWARHSTTINSIFVCFCNPARYILSFIFYRRDKWGSLQLSNFLKFIHLVRNIIRLWHILQKIMPSVLPGRNKGSSSQMRTDDQTLETVSRLCWQELVLHVPRTKSNYLWEFSLRSLKERHPQTFTTRSTEWNRYLSPPGKCAQAYKFQEAHEVAFSMLEILMGT